jgi:hypothetical protein
LEIWNSAGIMLSRKNNLNKNQEEIDVSGLSSGIHFIRIFSDKEMFTVRFLKR